MKKVIFIGGTSYSGSTLLDMILANDPSGFSCGEVHALFNPYREHHINPTCGCGDDNCHIWQNVKRNGKNNLYGTIFEILPNTEFIVDSSKNPFWIQHQMRILQKKNIEIKNILIFKTPLELAQSFKKRNKLELWERKDINYYMRYFSLIKDWRSIEYYELSHNKGSVRKLCEYLNLPYFEGKEEYWDKKQHTLFGNTSAKIHLYEKDENCFDIATKELLGTTTSDEHSLNRNHRTIFYENIEDDELDKLVQKRIKTNSTLYNISKQLKLNSINGGLSLKRKEIHSGINADMKFERAWLIIRRLQYHLRSKKFRVRHILKRG